MLAHSESLDDSVSDSALVEAAMDSSLCRSIIPCATTTSRPLSLDAVLKQNIEAYKKKRNPQTSLQENDLVQEIYAIALEDFKLFFNIYYNQHSHTNDKEVNYVRNELLKLRTQLEATQKASLQKGDEEALLTEFYKLTKRTDIGTELPTVLANYLQGLSKNFQIKASLASPFDVIEPKKQAEVKQAQKVTPQKQNVIIVKMVQEAKKQKEKADFLDGFVVVESEKSQKSSSKSTSPKVSVANSQLYFSQPKMTEPERLVHSEPITEIEKQIYRAGEQVLNLFSWLGAGSGTKQASPPEKNISPTAGRR